MNPARLLIPLCIISLAFLGSSDTLSAQNATFTASPSQLVFNIPQPGIMPGQNSAQLSISGPAGSSVQFSTSAPTWLSLTPASGIVSGSPAAIVVSLTPAALSLQSGVYSGVLLVTQTGGSPVLQALPVPVVLNVGNQLAVAPSNAVNLSYQNGQAPPFATLNVTSTVSSLPFSITQVQPASSWLLPGVSPNASTPGTVTVSINPNGLAAGYYTGSFRIASTTAGVSPQDVTVNLTVTDAPALSASPQQLSFVYQTGTTTGALPSRTVSLTTNGGLLGFTVDPSTQSWLNVVANGSVASQVQPATLSITVNPNSPVVLQPGNYSANITVRPLTGGNSLVIQVTLFVSAKPLLSLGTAPAAFSYQVNGTAPADQTITIASSSTPLDFTVTDKPTWLDVLPGAGSTNLVASLTLHVNPAVIASLGTGSFSGSVTISAPQAGNPSVSFPVTLNVTFVPTLSTNISGLTFNYQTTTALQPAAQFFNVASTGAQLALGAPVVSTTSCGNSWLSATISGNQTPAVVYVSVTATGINQPATCSGTVSIPSPNTTSLSIPVTLNVSANALLNVSAPDLTFSAPLGATTALQRNISLSSTDLVTPLNFSVTSNVPWLTPSVASGRTDSTQSFTIYVNPGVFVQAGTYTGNLTITNQSANPAGSQPGQILRVTMTVNSNIVLSVTPQVINVAVPPGGAAASQTVQINLSSGSAGFTAFATTVQGGGWLKIALGSNPPATTANGTAPATLTVIADPSSLGLAPGDYKGAVTISSGGLQGSPQTVNVNLTVGSTQSILLNLPSIAITSSSGAIGNVTGSFTVAGSGGTVAFTITRGASNCDAISVSPATGNAGTTPVPITVTLNQTGLAVGSFACALTVSGPVGSGISPQTLTVNVTVAAAPVPLVTAVKNAASYAAGAIAPGEVIQVGGSNLGPTTLTTYILNPDRTFATTVGGTMVFFDSVAAPILYVRNDILSVVVPFEIAGRVQTSITVQRLGQTSAPLQMQLAQVAPGIFTTNQQGTGQGAILNQDGVTVNSASNPAPRGSVVSIYFTGGGTMSYGNQSGTLLPVSPLPSLNGQTTVTMAGQPAQVLYQGGAPGSIAGLYQINAMIPSGAPSGPVILGLAVNGIAAQGNVTVFVQ